MKEKISDTETNDVAEELEAERKASAGKDRKLTELQAELKKANTRLEENRLGPTESETLERDGLIRIAEGLKLREEELTHKEKAVNLAVTKNVPIDLMLRGADDLDKYLDELAQFQARSLKAAGVKGFSKSGDTKPPELKKLSRSEWGRIPSRIFDAMAKEEK